MATRNFDTGGSGGGGIPNPNKKAAQLGNTWTSALGSALGTGFKDVNKIVVDAARQAGLQSKTASSSSGNFYCPEGATLVKESNGSGNLVCRWQHNGAEFAALSRSGGGTVSTGGGGSSAGSSGGSATGGGTGSGVATTGGGGTASAPVVQTDSPWLQSAADTFARNPDAYLADALYQQYGDTGGNALYGQLQPYMDAANVLFLAQNGQSAETGTKDAFLDYLDQYVKLLQTPGARIDAQGALQNIMNPAEGSPLYSYLTMGNPEDMAGNLLRLMSGVASTSYHPLVANAMMDRLGLEADRYMGASGRGATDPFYQTLSLNIPGFNRLVKG